MEPYEYVAIVRRRWRIIAVVFGLAIALALVAPSPDTSSAGDTWRATSVLVTGADTTAPVDEATSPLGDVGLLARTDAVLEGVASDVGSDAPSSLVDLVEVTQDEGGLVTVTAAAATEEDAESLANAFATRIADAAADQIDLLRSDQIERLEAELAKASSELAYATAVREEVIAARQEAVRGEIARLATTASPPPLAVLQPAVGAAIRSDSLLSPPADPLIRAMLFGGLGLLLGGVAALVAERIDPRLLTPSELSRAHRMPLLVTTPAISDETRDGLPHTAREPESRAADAFRALRMSLLLATPRVPRLNAEAAEAEPARHARSGAQPPRVTALEESRVVLVTAGRAGVGVTTTVANLAATFSLSGMSVLLVDADQRVQSLSESFGVRGRPGVSDLLSRHSISTAAVDELAVPCVHLPGVRVLPAGASRPFRGADPARAEELLAVARVSAQVVLVDAAALLDSVEALEFAPFVDGVVIVARPGGVTRERAAQVADALAQLRIPCFGLVAANARGARQRVRRQRPARMRTTVQQVPRHAGNGGRSESDTPRTNTVPDRPAALS